MKLPFSFYFRVLVTGLVLLALPGCASAPASAAADGKAAPKAGAKRGKSMATNLRKGMTPEEVRALLGPPTEVQPVEAPEGTAERWTYRQVVDVVMEQKVTGTQELPYVDPITGQTRTIFEPVYSYEKTTVTEELKMLWFNGALTSWVARTRDDRSYAN